MNDNSTFFVTSTRNDGFFQEPQLKKTQIEQLQLLVLSHIGIGLQRVLETGPPCRKKVWR